MNVKKDALANLGLFKIILLYTCGRSGASLLSVVLAELCHFCLNNIDILENLLNI